MRILKPTSHISLPQPSTALQSSFFHLFFRLQKPASEVTVGHFFAETRKLSSKNSFAPSLSSSCYACFQLVGEPFPLHNNQRADMFFFSPRFLGGGKHGKRRCSSKQEALRPEVPIRMFRCFRDQHRSSTPTIAPKTCGYPPSHAT